VISTSWPVPQEAVRSDIPFMRTGRVDAWRDELGPETIALIEGRYTRFMADLGYQPIATGG
jgi:hypothetical protein